MAGIELDTVKRLAAYLDWALDEAQRETGSQLAGTRAGELLANATATARELLNVLGVSPRVLGTNQPPDDSSTRH
jgi:hypothetical protein